MPEGRRLFPKLTVEENLMMGENINKVKGKKPDYDLIYEYFPRLKVTKSITDQCPLRPSPERSGIILVSLPSISNAIIMCFIGLL